MFDNNRIREIKEIESLKESSLLGLSFNALPNHHDNRSHYFGNLYYFPEYHESKEGG